jgi:hypothetical protein
LRFTDATPQTEERGEFSLKGVAFSSNDSDRVLIDVALGDIPSRHARLIGISYSPDREQALVATDLSGFIAIAHLVLDQGKWRVGVTTSDGGVGMTSLDAQTGVLYLIERAPNDCHKAVVLIGDEQKVIEVGPSQYLFVTLWNQAFPDRETVPLRVLRFMS